jgi:hypothetical protein
MVGDVNIGRHLGTQLVVILCLLLVEHVTLDDEVIVLLVAQRVDDVKKVQPCTTTTKNKYMYA